MVQVRTALPAVVGLLLLGSFLIAPATSPPDTYTVTVQTEEYPSDPAPYDELSAGTQRAFDAALASNGSVEYTGQERPENIPFPDSNGLTSEDITYQNETYFVQYEHTIHVMGMTPLLRTLGSLAGGVVLLAYAGYRRFA
ncbi:hypothetical protein [Halobacterium jilantaiense]|uniref:DUF7979 domain-containing protein n=1 Tax=Halobacterium jilantaiense TaxID=355548 RepID=A0A1I0NBT0_9EURY|nr:hypothetical protein [Halobacterium jilantaiense]SEV98456.1 hypothetical protein SAMN04487945_0738 [Halobacterium jilantaiense]